MQNVVEIFKDQLRRVQCHPQASMTYQTYRGEFDQIYSQLSKCLQCLQGKNQCQMNYGDCCRKRAIEDALPTLKRAYATNPERFVFFGEGKEEIKEKLVHFIPFVGISFCAAVCKVLGDDLRLNTNSSGLGKEEYFAEINNALNLLKGNNVSTYCCIYFSDYIKRGVNEFNGDFKKFFEEALSPVLRYLCFRTSIGETAEGGAHFREVWVLESDLDIIKDNINTVMEQLYPPRQTSDEKTAGQNKIEEYNNTYILLKINDPVRIIIDNKGYVAFTPLILDDVFGIDSNFWEPIKTSREREPYKVHVNNTCVNELVISGIVSGAGGSKIEFVTEFRYEC